MKLIIDIPDNQYNQICELRLHNRTIYDDAIRNGTPLDKIKEKIKEKVVYYHARKQHDKADGLVLTLGIIDAYTNGDIEVSE